MVACQNHPWHADRPRPFVPEKMEFLRYPTPGSTAEFLGE